MRGCGHPATAVTPGSGGWQAWRTGGLGFPWIRMLRERHHWRWKDVRHRFTTPTGAWLPVTAGQIERKRIAAIPVTRYRYRGARSTIPGSRNAPDGRHRGEPVAPTARRVRRAARGHGPGAIPAPRPGHTRRTPGLWSGTYEGTLYNCNKLGEGSPKGPPLVAGPRPNGRGMCRS
jgi:hypothetical protein